MSKYDWLLTDGVILLEGYQPPLFPGLDYDAEHAAELALQAGARIFRFPTLSYYAYYPTEHYVLHPQLGGRDLLEETIRACHKRGIKVFPYIPVGHPFLPHDADLEPYNSWAKLDEKGERRKWWHHGYFNSYYICLNTPYREAIKKIVTEIVEGYDIDGVYFDGPYQDQTSSGDFCYCSYCRQAYYDKTGKEIPVDSGPRDWNNPDILMYLDWVINDVKRGLMKELNSIIKRKDLPHLFNNCGWLANKYWGGDRYNDVDGFMFEGVHTSQEKLMHVMLGRSTGKYIWSYTGSYQAANHNHLVMDIEGAADYAAIPAYEDELRNEGFTVIAGNAAPIYYSVNRVYYQQDSIEKIRDVFGYLGKNSGMLMEARNKSFIGMCVSGRTRDWWFKNDDSKNSKYRYFTYGGFNVLKDLYHQAEPFYLSPESREGLSKYKIVMLPNTACMTDEEADDVRRYVREGGNLIATFMTSLYDGQGNMRENFALSDVFGVNYAVKDVEMRRDSYIRLKGGHPVLKGFRDGQLMPQDLQFLTVEAVNPEETVGVTTGMGHDIDICPAITARDYGKGRVVYMAGGLEALYRTSRFRDISRLFDNIINWMAKGEIPYEIQGASGLVVNMNETEDATLLHIVNNNCDNVKFAPVREVYVPVFDIKAKINTGNRKVRSVRLLYSDTDLLYKTAEGYIEVTIPRLQVYECICVQYEK